MWVVEIPSHFKVSHHITVTRMLYMTGNCEKAVWRWVCRLGACVTFFSRFLLIRCFPCFAFILRIRNNANSLYAIWVRSTHCVTELNKIQQYSFHAWSVWTRSSSRRFVPFFPFFSPLENFHIPSHKWYFPLSLGKGSSSNHQEVTWILNSCEDFFSFAFKIQWDTERFGSTITPNWKSSIL